MIESTLIESTLIEELAELEGAEEFLDYFEITYDPAIVQVNRLHILQRFHDYLEAADDIPEDEISKRQKYAHYLRRAYRDFVESDALTERVFKILKSNQAPATTFVPLSKAFR